MIKDKRKKVAIIYEGEKTEENLFKSIGSHFFGKHADILIMTLPAAANLYMLWSKLQEDNFETDVISVLKEMNGDISKRLEGVQTEDFAEIYLFFDYDGHQDNIPKKYAGKDVLKEMLMTFDNETELGKLYISYPMLKRLKRYLQRSRITEHFICPLKNARLIKRQSRERRIMVISAILQKGCGLLRVMPAENVHQLLSLIRKKRITGIL